MPVAENTSVAAESGTEETYTESIAVVADNTHYFMTTDFADYTVTEGLLLCIFVLMIVKSISRVIKEGFYWLW